MTNSLIVRKILRFKSLESTQDVAIDYAKKGEKEGLVVFAEKQTKGRGRLGRNWFALPFKSLTFSVLLRPPISLELSPFLSLFPALACAQALEKLGIKCSLKWPNDILIEGKKAGGILTEMESRGAFIEWAVVGVGINVNIEREDFPKELRETATSLYIALGKNLDIHNIFEIILKELNEKYPLCLSEEGRKKLRELYDERDFLKEKFVEVGLANGDVVKGVAEGINEKGFLRVRRGDKITIVPAGDVFILKNKNLLKEA